MCVDRGCSCPSWPPCGPEPLQLHARGAGLHWGQRQRMAPNHHDEENDVKAREISINISTYINSWSMCSVSCMLHRRTWQRQRISVRDELNG